MPPEKIRKIAKLLNLSRSSEPHEALSAIRMAGEIVGGDFGLFFDQLTSSSFSEEQIAVLEETAYRQGWRDCLAEQQSQRTPSSCQECVELFEEARRLKFTEGQADWIVKLETAFKNQGNLSEKQFKTLIDIVRKGRR